MNDSKLNGWLRAGQIVGGAAVLGAIIYSPALFTQDTFDPTSVQPRSCQNGRYNCGMKPPTKEQFESIPLSPSEQIRHRGLPARVDLSSKMPPVGHQGTQGSCVAWASGYALKSYHEKVERGWSYDAPATGGAGNRVFSPAYIYNQINGGRDDGSVISDALDLIVRQGAAPWSAMPYKVSDYRSKPKASARRLAAQYKGQSYRRLKTSNLDAIKAELSKGNPVVFGIGVDEAFYSLKSEVYDRSRGQFFGGHAMTLVGYDDSKRSPRGHRGAFKLINSWGTSWGDRGYGWISYKKWLSGDAWALVLYDRVDSNSQNENDPDEPADLEDEEDERLSPPASLTATQGSYPGKVVVNWAAVDGASVYIVARAEPSNPKSFRSIAYAQGTSHTDTKVQADVAYRYIVVAVADKKNYSDPEDSPIAEGYAASKKQVTKPGKVAGITAKVKAVAGRGAIAINWSKVASATSYQVARFNKRSKKWTLLSRGTRNDSFTDPRPVANQTNYYSVRAVNRAGRGPWGEPASIDIGGKETVPAAPTGVKATQGTFRDKVEFRWNKVPGATQYYVFRYSYKDRKWADPVLSRGNKYVDTRSDLSRGDWFAYVAVASNAAGNSKHSKAVIGRANPNATRAGLVLPPPENVRAQMDEATHTVTIEWDRVKGASQYYVFRKREKDSDYKFVKDVDGSTLRFSEAVPGEAGDLFFYVVRSKSALGGESENSKEVAGYRNEELEFVRHRFLPGQGLDRFAGKWVARHWTGRGAPVEIQLEITPNGGDFTGSFKRGRFPARKFRGSYAANSDVLNAKGIQLRTTEIDGTLRAEVEPGSLSRTPMTLSFSRVEG